MTKDVLKSFQDFIKDNIKGATEPLNNVEKELREVLDKIGKQKLSKDELKNRLDEMVSKLKELRSSIEKSMDEGLARTLSTLNLPTRSELNKLAKKVDRLSREVSKLTKAPQGKKASPTKTIVKKSVAKKTPKKVVKKTKTKAGKKTG